MSRIRLITLLISVAALLCGRQAVAQKSAETTLPGKAASLIAAHCIKCHGQDKRSGGVDLSTRKLAIASNAFVPGDAVHSEAVIVTHQGKMPPDTVLTDAEKDLIRDWIAAGAVYTREPLIKVEAQNKLPWSFRPIKHYDLPTSKFDALSSNPIDRFLFARLQKAGLSPSPPANRRELLRRVTVDLTGLPPTVEEIDNFIADRSANAYEKVVDRLLASPRYGERWGRHWLDVVRYGESNGYEQNHLRPNAWPYRDYVIRAFNEDKPYDQFLTEQLAGDIIGRGKPEVEVATGFLVAGIHDTVPILSVEGPKQQRANDLDDITATTGVTFLGVSLNCARCHDHKFDPIPSRDYYRITSAFSGVHHGERELSVGPVSTESANRLNALRKQQQDDDRTATQLLGAGRKVLTAANNGKKEPVNSYHNEDVFAPTTARYIRFTITATNNGSEPCLDEVEVYGPDANSPNLALSSTGAKATASSLLPGYDIHQISHLNDGLHGNSHSWISNERSKGWAQIELPAEAAVARVVWARDAEKKLTDRVPTEYTIELSSDGRTWRQAASSAERSANASAFSDDKARMALRPDQRLELDRLGKERDDLQSSIDQISPIKTVYCGTFASPESIHILPQGDVMRPGDAVTPGTLSLIPGVSGDLAANGTDARLALARWMCDGRNPLTPRVIVNRLWEWHFGRGIVDTPSDFGNMGSLPSHPELLDWLASDLMSHQWRLKRLHRLIVTSYAYRQSSAVTPSASAKDGDNRLVWHMPLRRMEAEAVRDSILAVSGKLMLEPMGGPGYRLFKYSVLNVAIFETRDDQGPDTWRRGVYQIPARGIRDELLGAFDSPDSSERAADRSSTTTALQALSMLNGMFVNQQAGFFAERVRGRSPNDTGAQVRTAFRLAFGRPPAAAELTLSAKLVNDDGLAALCRGLINSNEFLYY